VKGDRWRIIEERLTGKAARNVDGTFVEKLGTVPMQNSGDGTPEKAVKEC